MSIEASSYNEEQRVEPRTITFTPDSFEPFASGQKDSELTVDRGYKVGEGVTLQEIDPDTNETTGREIQRKISYITSLESPCALSSEALNPNYCILSFSPVVIDQQ